MRILNYELGFDWETFKTGILTVAFIVFFTIGVLGVLAILVISVFVFIISPGILDRWIVSYSGVFWVISGIIFCGIIWAMANLSIKKKHTIGIK